jgi:hypothetical protein
LDLTEARTIKSDFSAAWEATRLIDAMAQVAPDAAVQFLKDLVANPKSWEAEECGFEFCSTNDSLANESNVSRWKYAFSRAFGDRAVAASESDPKVDNAIVVPGKWVDFLKNGGVQTVKTTVVTLRPKLNSYGSIDRSATVIAPSGDDMIVFEMPIPEARRLLSEIKGRGFTFEKSLKLLIGGE